MRRAISGQLYFVNRRSNTTQWHHPGVAADVEGLRSRLASVSSQLQASAAQLAARGPPHSQGRAPGADAAPRDTAAPPAGAAAPNDGAPQAPPLAAPPAGPASLPHGVTGLGAAQQGHPLPGVASAPLPGTAQPHPAFPVPAENPLAYARLRSPAQLQQALAGWIMRLHEVAGVEKGDGRVQMQATFASCISSEVDLHNTAAAMGINVMQAVARPRRGGASSAFVGAEPPFALILGCPSQPGLDVTFATQPRTKLSIQLLNKTLGKIVCKGSRSALERNIEELLTFFGPCTELKSSAPPTPAQGSLRAAPRQPARQLLAAAESAAPPAA